MDRIASRVANFGALLACFGAVSSVITFFDYELRILMWIELWGPLVAWGIRLGLIAVGVGIFFVAGMLDKSDSPEARAAAQEAERRAWDALKSHPRVQQLIADASRSLRIVWEPNGDPDAYVVRNVVWQDAQYRWLVDGTGPSYGPDDPRVTNVALYLERLSPPQRIVCGMDLATRSLVQQEAHPGTWAAFVGG
jgi:hypothetical protein